MNTVRTEHIACLGAELIWERLFDQLTTLPRAGHGLTSAGHFNAAFAPIDMEPGTTAITLLIKPPANGQSAGGLTKRAIFYSIRGKLMESHRQRLDRGRSQAHPARSFEAGALGTAIHRRKFTFDQFVEGNPVMFVET